MLGKNGRGTAEHFGVSDKVDILTGSFGKSLGGGNGGFVVAKNEVVSYLRQSCRPYLFSNAISSFAAAGVIKALEVIEENKHNRSVLRQNTEFFRKELKELKFRVKGNELLPIVLIESKEGEADKIKEMLERKGILVEVTQS